MAEQLLFSQSAAQNWKLRLGTRGHPIRHYKHADIEDILRSRALWVTTSHAKPRICIIYEHKNNWFAIRFQQSSPAHMQSVHGSVLPSGCFVFLDCIRLTSFAGLSQHSTTKISEATRLQKLGVCGSEESLRPAHKETPETENAAGPKSHWSHGVKISRLGRDVGL